MRKYLLADPLDGIVQHNFLQIFAAIQCIVIQILRFGVPYHFLDTHPGKGPGSRHFCDRFRDHQCDIGLRIKSRCKCTAFNGCNGIREGDTFERRAAVKCRFPNDLQTFGKYNLLQRSTSIECCSSNLCYRIRDNSLLQAIAAVKSICTDLRHRRRDRDRLQLRAVPKSTRPNAGDSLLDDHLFDIHIHIRP